MGSAASTLTKAQAEEMQRLMKVEQEANPTASEEEIHKIMLEKHKDALAKALKENETPPTVQTTTSATTIERTPSKGGEKEADKSEKAPLAGTMQKIPSNPKLANRSASKGPTRRRSFGEDKKTGSTPSKGGIAQSESNAAIATAVSAAASAAGGEAAAAATVQKDSWDSVTEQPYCAVCCMGFKTASALDRHVKYSDLHAKQVAKLNSNNDSAPLSPKATPFGKDKKTLQPTQEEGTHYRLFYSGSKLFWRTSDNIDIDIYFHVISHTIEVIAYDNVKSREWRLYFQYEKLVSYLYKPIQDSIEAKKIEQSKEAATNKFTINPTSGISKEKYDEVMQEEARQTVITSFILNRIQMEGGNSATNLTTEIKFVPSIEGDDSACIETPPGSLIPIQVNRRRKTSSEEISNTISTLQMDYAALRNATARAERIASLVFEGASMFSAFLQAESVSKWAKKWRWAIRLVIRQKHVAETTAHLEKLEKAKLEREKELAGPQPAGARLSVQKLRRSFEGKP